ncbi:hypothetical protein [Lacticaseibacillus yichunensis]|uniref:Phage protein n=1 Tax=Lacticaseibacillus yichunensis TaxID=2486015 RepID=A0ABW4CMX4_9LACO|nr:hypothetical protein [Lacticaseibacillus yichunensis]
MAKYRKKPVVVDAWKIVPIDIDSVVPVWLFNAMANHEVNEHGEGYIIQTLEGEMIASPGDYIIRGVMGELYPCKPDIFKATYEPA